MPNIRFEDKYLNQIWKTTEISSNKEAAINEKIEANANCKAVIIIGDVFFHCFFHTHNI